MASLNYAHFYEFLFEKNVVCPFELWKTLEEDEVEEAPSNLGEIFQSDNPFNPLSVDNFVVGFEVLVFLGSVRKEV